LSGARLRVPLARAHPVAAAALAAAEPRPAHARLPLPPLLVLPLLARLHHAQAAPA
jgi:hypothetical protein